MHLFPVVYWFKNTYQKNISVNECMGCLKPLLADRSISAVIKWFGYTLWLSKSQEVFLYLGYRR
jgi:hypothetical protein